jgi:hypothetical protein
MMRVFCFIFVVLLSFSGCDFRTGNADADTLINGDPEAAEATREAISAQTDLSAARRSLVTANRPIEPATRVFCR